MALTVSVKWQKETFQNLEIDTSQPPIVFKGQLFALTGVPTDRQKIMVKGGLLQDDADWSTVGVKQGQRLMMMGTAEAAPQAPTQSVVFVEDLPEEDRDGATRSDISAGLVNLGNTCYMNSTLQCLSAVPELKSNLLSYDASSGIDADTSHRLTLATRDIFKEMETSMRPVTPFLFLHLLRQKFPQFAQQGEHGSYMQQDAEECWTQLLFSLSQRLRSAATAKAAVSDLFEIEFGSKVKCEASGEETEEKESAFMLKCHISSDVNLLHQGLKQGLTTELEKVSPKLGHSTVFTKSSQITRLPPYLTVQFVRFFWKRESQQKAKILRKVSFPVLLDVYDLCAPSLQAQLDGPRRRLREAADREAARQLASKGAPAASTSASQANGTAASSSAAPSSSAAATVASAAATGSGSTPAGKSDDMQVDGKAEEKKVEAGQSFGTTTSATATATSATATTSSTSAVASGELTGQYELVSVLTHKGRSADSGHYVGWVKQGNGSWVEFDDEQPIIRKEDDIVKLSGGGDWHMAYILLYKARVA